MNGNSSDNDRENPINVAKNVIESDEEGDCDHMNSQQYTEASTSANEWIGGTTNSDDCSYRYAELKYIQLNQIKYINKLQLRG